MQRAGIIISDRRQWGRQEAHSNAFYDTLSHGRMDVNEWELLTNGDNEHLLQTGWNADEQKDECKTLSRHSAVKLFA